MPRRFTIEKPAAEKEQDYQGKILKIVNDYERQIRLISKEESFVLDKEVHKKWLVDAERELKELEPIRQDICQSFNITDDPAHLYLASSGKGPEFQRGFPAFFILINALTGEGFYGEGRKEHVEILRNLIELARKRNLPLTMENLINDWENKNPQWLGFKGFLDKNQFKDLSSQTRKIIETPIFDEEGKKIETPTNWFIAGHNLSSSP